MLLAAGEQITVVLSLTPNAVLISTLTVGRNSKAQDAYARDNQFLSEEMAEAAVLLVRCTAGMQDHVGRDMEKTENQTGPIFVTYAHPEEDPISIAAREAAKIPSTRGGDRSLRDCWRKAVHRGTVLEQRPSARGANLA
jgi:hypothetical protein